MQKLWHLDTTAMFGESVVTVTPIVMELNPYNKQHRRAGSGAM